MTIRLSDYIHLLNLSFEKYQSESLSGRYDSRLELLICGEKNELKSVLTGMCLNFSECLLLVLEGPAMKHWSRVSGVD